MPWIEIQSPAPILNTPDFETVFGGVSGFQLPLNQEGHPFPYEFVALKGMRFKLLEKLGSWILKIQWPSYSSQPLFIDSRFCQPALEPWEKVPFLQSGEALLHHMESRLGVPYVWGGNYAGGIPEMLKYYPPKQALDAKIEELWTFRGVDCSGLLFEASNAATPRNTSHLLKYGRSLKLNEPIQPLDMIIYPGHVLFIRDENTIIESRSPFGVRICPLRETIEEIGQTRHFIREWSECLDPTSHFTIRRFL